MKQIQQMVSENRHLIEDSSVQAIAINSGAKVYSRTLIIR